jgi:hypothetical protein
MRKLVFGLVAWMATIACSAGSTSMDLQKYDRSCTNLNSCILVATDACCGCPTSAINADSQAQFDADFAAAKKNCANVACPGISCPNVTVGCQAGLCITQNAVADAGTD